MNLDFQIKVNRRAKRVILKLVKGNLVIVSPRKISVPAAQEIVNRNKDWVTAQLSKHQRHAQNMVNLDHGSNLTLMGQPTQISFVDASSKKITHVPTQIVVAAKENHREHLYKWLRKRAKQILPTRIRAFASAFGHQVANVSVRDQNSRWGSCSGNKNISINWRLMFAPLNVLDYVVVHELAHLKHLNHSAAFWNEVTRMMPDYQQHRRWLKLHGAELEVVGF